MMKLSKLSLVWVVCLFILFASPISFPAPLVHADTLSISMPVISYTKSETTTQRSAIPGCTTASALLALDSLFAVVRCPPPVTTTTNVSTTFSDPHNTAEYDLVTTSSKTTTGSCTSWYDWPGTSGASGPLGCRSTDPQPTTGPLITTGQNRGSGQTTYPVYGQDVYGSPTTLYYIDDSMSETSQKDLVLNGGDSSINYTATFPVGVSPIIPYSQTGPSGVATNGWSYGSEISCHNISVPSGKVYKDGWFGNNCYAVVSVKGNSAVDVTPSSDLSYYSYSAGPELAVSLDPQTKAAPSLSGAQTSVVPVTNDRNLAAAANALKLLPVTGVGTTPPDTAQATTTLTLTGSGFDAAHTNYILLTPIPSVVGTIVCPIDASATSTCRNLGFDTSTYDTVQIKAVAATATSLVFDIPSSLVQYYEVQVRTQGSSWSQAMVLSDALGTTRPVPIVVTKQPPVNVSQQPVTPTPIPKKPLVPVSIPATPIPAKIAPTYSCAVGSPTNLLSGVSTLVVCQTSPTAGRTRLGPAVVPKISCPAGYVYQSTGAYKANPMCVRTGPAYSCPSGYSLKTSVCISNDNTASIWDSIIEWFTQISSFSR